MTGTDEFGRELDAQQYERAAGGENGVRPERVAGPRPPQPGAPADAPWMAGGSVGYAEAVFGQGAGIPGRPVPGPGAGAAYPAGHDAPTTEFFPGAIFDAGEPEDYQVPPPPVPNQGSSMPLGQLPGAGHPVPFAAPLPQQDPEPVELPNYEPAYDPLGGSLGGSSSWSAAPPRAPQVGLGQSGAHEVQPSRPAVPAQPMPGPEPLPGRGAVRENPVRQAAAAPPAVPRSESMAPPRRRVGPQPVQAQPQPQPQSAPAPQPLAPLPAPQPQPAPEPRQRPTGAAVPAPRLPEHSSQDLPVLPPPAAAPAPAPVAPVEEPSQDIDEMVVPWQAVAPAGIEGFAGPRGAGTRRRPEGESGPGAVPEPLSAPQPVLLEPDEGEDEYDLSYGEPEDAADLAEYEDEDPYTQAVADPPAPPQPAAPQPVRPQRPQAAAPQAAVPQPVQAPAPQQPQPQPAQAPAPQQPQPQPQPVQAPVPPDLAGPTSATSPARRPAAARPVPAQAKPAAPQPAQPQPPQPQPQPAAVPAAVQTPQPAPASVSARPPQPSATRRPARVKPEPRGAEVSVPAQAAQDTRGRAPGYTEDALEAVYRVIHERRDIRNDFLPDEVPTEVLTRILEAAHTAPSVGFSQPWDFLVLRDTERRQAVHDLADRQRRAYAASLPKARAKAFAALKIEAILDTPVNIVVTCDPTRGGRHTLGRYTQPMMAPFSTCLAVENLWLAARAEGLGVGWVSFFDERELAETLNLPPHLQIVAYLCVGYVRTFPGEPELAGAGWAKRRPLAWAVHEEDFGRRSMPGGEPVSLLDATVDAVRGLDEDATRAARDRQNRMTKPPGSLGMLETVAEQLAGLSGQCPPPMPEPAALAVFAADHGVHAQGVTPWPQEVTAQMVSNFLAGGAVVNAFAKQVGAEVCVVDVGVAAHLGDAAGLVPRKVRLGTADMTQGPAMSRQEAVAAVEAGIETARDLVAAGNRCLLTGDMGIANTTASAALIAAFTGASPAQVTGYGTGIDEQTYAHKVEIVRRALQLHRPDPQDPIGVLAAFGGLEHAALAGFILGGAALRVPVVLDGVIAGAAALVAQAIAPEATAACVAGHRSAEPGHALALEALGIHPLIDLELRLGEGSGAVLALPLVAAAVRALREVATFDSAGVADASASVVSPTERERH